MEWINIKTQQPPKPKGICDRYICAVYDEYARGESTKGYSVQIIPFFSNGFDFNGGNTKITHWMPFPETSGLHE